MANVSIFVPHNGCPHKCSFCDQRHITGCVSQPTAEDVKKAVSVAVESLGSKTKDAEIAFFGGSFTAIDRDYMIELLESTQEFIHLFKGIRVSTRPDAVNEDILCILKKYNVTSIELGAQSMIDSVLTANERGHNANDIINASKLIKDAGFSLGLQMMTGLYKSTIPDDLTTAEEFIKLKPDTVRIYPTVVLKNTTLCDLYESGEYKPLDAEVSVMHCAKIILMFEKAGINIIRVGLHASETIESNMVAGAFHPAFRELCESRIYHINILSDLLGGKYPKGDITVFVPKGDLSKAIGHKRKNKELLKSLGFNARFMEDNTLVDRQVLIKKG